MRVSALLPLACSMVAFILGMLCLFAGHKPGFMEDYHIVSVSFVLTLVSWQTQGR